MANQMAVKITKKIGVMRKRQHEHAKWTWFLITPNWCEDLLLSQTEENYIQVNFVQVDGTAQPLKWSRIIMVFSMVLHTEVAFFPPRLPKMPGRRGYEILTQKNHR